MSELTDRLRLRLQDTAPLLHFHERWFTGSEFLSDIADVQMVLRRMEIARGDRILLIEGNSYAFAAAYLGIVLYGATVIPVNPAMPGPELDKLTARSGAVGAFVQFEALRYFMEKDVDPKGLIRFVATLASVGSMSCIGRLYEQSDAHWHQRELSEFDAERLDAKRMLVDPSNAPAEDVPAILLFTSGTTGDPKGVALTHRHVMAAARNISTAHRLGPEDVSYCFLPMFHINAQVIAFLTTLVSGGRLILESKFSATRFWETVVRHRVSWVSAVPTVIAILIKGPGPAPSDHRLRFVRSASAPLPALHARRFEALFGIPVIESYGMTEAASQICVNPLPPAARKFGSVGLPVGVELRVADDQGRFAGPGETGEIVIRGDSVISAYAHGEEDGKSFRDGFFHTGDVGYMDRDGYVYITGRSKELINRAGQKISPREVEEVIVQHPDVRSAAVIGVPDELYGERVVAYVVAENRLRGRDRALEDELRALCRSSISAYKCPAEIYTVDELPVGPTGKIQRYRLRQQVLENSLAN